MAKRDEHFVRDGHERAAEASLPSIQAQVKAEYAERLVGASWYRRFWLWLEMRREVRRRLERAAPPWGLYCSR
jgi:hypothetical protein